MVPVCAILSGRGCPGKGFRTSPLETAADQGVPARQPKAHRRFPTNPCVPSHETIQKTDASDSIMSAGRLAPARRRSASLCGSDSADDLPLVHARRACRRGRSRPGGRCRLPRSPGWQPKNSDSLRVPSGREAIHLDQVSQVTRTIGLAAQVTFVARHG